jgi:hypothetical protein
VSVILSTAYWPNLLYFYHLLNNGPCIIEQHENYQKQSFRTRAQILSANGVLDLVVPIQHFSTKQRTKDIQIAYGQKWQHQHWHAIESAYRKSPFFGYFEDEIKELYTKEFRFLFDYNIQQLQLVHKILQLPIRFGLSDEYLPAAMGNDLRTSIHPKTRTILPPALNVAYYQTFGEKFGFVPNLSILDLLFNTGLNARKYFEGRQEH